MPNEGLGTTMQRTNADRDEELKMLAAAVERAEEIARRKNASDVAEIDHYTSTKTVANILEGAAQGHREGKGLTLRLYDSYGMNDPREGRFIKEQTLSAAVSSGRQVNKTVYILCGTEPGNENGLKNRLDCWRLYGDDGKGAVLRLRLNRKKLYDLGVDACQVAYKDSERVEYEKHTRELEEACRRSEQALGRIGSNGKPRRNERREISRAERIAACLRWGQKSKDFESEHEVRLVTRIPAPEQRDINGKLVIKHGIGRKGRLRRWVEIDIQECIEGSGLEIILGPLTSADQLLMWEESVSWWGPRMGISLSRSNVHKSEAEYKA